MCVDHIALIINWSCISIFMMQMIVESRIIRCYVITLSFQIVIMFFKKESNKDKNWSPFVGFGDIIFEDFWNWKKEERRNRMTQCLWCKWRMLDLTWRMFEIVWKGERTVKYLCKHYCITNSYTLIFFTSVERWINNFNICFLDFQFDL